MTVQVPLKLVDAGSGQGQLKEFATGDQVPGAQLQTFTGATASVDGTPGAVPAPAAGPITDYLARDGSWKAIPAAGGANLTQSNFISKLTQGFMGKYFEFFDKQVGSMVRIGADGIAAGVSTTVVTPVYDPLALFSASGTAAGFVRIAAQGGSVGLATGSTASGSANIRFGNISDYVDSSDNWVANVKRVECAVSAVLPVLSTTTQTYTFKWIVALPGYSNGTFEIIYTNGTNGGKFYLQNGGAIANSDLTYAPVANTQFTLRVVFTKATRTVQVYADAGTGTTLVLTATDSVSTGGSGFSHYTYMTKTVGTTSSIGYVGSFFNQIEFN